MQREFINSQRFFNPKKIAKSELFIFTAHHFQIQIRRHLKNEEHILDFQYTHHNLNSGTILALYFGMPNYFLVFYF